MQTLSTLGIHIRHALGVAADQPIGDEYDIAEVVNLAGDWLCTAHHWKWLESATVALSLTANQDYVSLPSDFRAIKALVATDGLSRTVVVSGMNEILALRTRGISQGTVWFTAPNYRRLGTTAIPAPVLEFFPPATTDAADVWTLHYTAGWKQLRSDSDAASVPEWMEGILIQAVREYALGLEGDGGAPLMIRLSALTESPFFMQARDRDGSINWNVGPLRGGAAGDDGLETVPPFQGPFSNP